MMVIVHPLSDPDICASRNHMPDVVFCFGILRTGEIRWWQAADFSAA
jgi:hypothetical protein